MVEITQAQLERNRGKQAAARLEHIAQRREVVEQIARKVTNLERVMPEMRDPVFSRSLPGLIEQLAKASAELTAAEERHAEILAAEALPPISAEEREVIAKANREREAARWVAKRDASAAITALKKWPPPGAVASAAPASAGILLGDPEPAPAAVAVKRSRGRPVGWRKKPLADQIAERVVERAAEQSGARAKPQATFTSEAAAIAARGGSRHG